MKRNRTSQAIQVGFFSFFLATATSAAGTPETAGSSSNELRHFLFMGEPSATAWQFMIDNPGDRKSAVSEAFQALGGEVVSYYFGLGDGKNYITVTLPNDNELIQAVYLMRLPSGMLASYEVVELMPSEQMTEALKRAKELIEEDTTVEKD